MTMLEERLGSFHTSLGPRLVVVAMPAMPAVARGTVKSRTSRALGRLRSELEGTS